ALANRTSSLPFWRLISSTRRSRSARFDTSPWIAVTFPPISFAAAARSGARRPVMNTCAPSRANCFAVASPMPLLPPVTSATFPSSLPMPCLLLRPRRSGVLRDAVAERPVFLPDLDEPDENVLAPQADARPQAGGDGLVEGLLGLDGASFVQRKLDDQRVGAALDSKIGRVDDERVGRVLGDHLEAVVLRGFERLDHRLVDDVGHGAAVARRLAGRQIDAYERHGGLLALYRQRGEKTCICTNMSAYAYLSKPSVRSIRPSRLRDGSP